MLQGNLEHRIQAHCCMIRWNPLIWSRLCSLFRLKNKWLKKWTLLRTPLVRRRAPQTTTSSNKTSFLLTTAFPCPTPENQRHREGAARQERTHRATTSWPPSSRTTSPIQQVTNTKFSDLPLWKTIRLLFKTMTSTPFPPTWRTNSNAHQINWYSLRNS